MVSALRGVPTLLAQPARVLRRYPRDALGADLLAGATVALVLVPQALAFSLLAGLPPEMGLYAAIGASIAGALWGSSSHLHTGPTNTASILTLSVLLPIAPPGSPTFIAAAGLIAIMSGGLRVALGLARLGMLVNFVSDAVAVGFTAGAGVLIISNQLAPLLRMSAPPTAGLFDTLRAVVLQISAAHLPSLLLGLGTMILLVLLPRLQRRLPAVLVAVILASLAAWVLNLEALGVRMIGALPASLPPLANVPLFDLQLIGELANGALALAIIGLVEATAIARVFASHSGQRLDSNQEFVGQGMANICAGLLSGYPCSGSFNRSALSYQAGGRTAVSNAATGVFVLVAMLLLNPLIHHLPRPVLAGALVITAYSMIDRKAMARIWRGDYRDAGIMVITLVATLVLPLQFAVLTGVLMSLAYYLLQTSAPEVQAVLPDDEFRHWLHQPHKPDCPQMPVVDLLGDLYFGAANHVEDRLYSMMQRSPAQHLLLVRMHSVQRIDLSGIRSLEIIRRICRGRGGDLYLVGVSEPVAARMRAAGFFDQRAHAPFADEEQALKHLFYHVIDPAICIYECEVRAFFECQHLPKRSTGLPQLAPPGVMQAAQESLAASVRAIAPQELWEALRGEHPPLVIDVREPREYQQGHVPGARSLPLYELLASAPGLPRDQPLVLVCRSGRRSARAAVHLRSHQYTHLATLQGGMLAWEALNLLEAVETPSLQ